MAICTLDDQTRYCNEKCDGCGWNLKDRKIREKLTAANKLTVCPDGLKRLIIKRKVSEE